MRRVYDPNHYGMGFTTVALTLRPSKPRKAMTPGLGIVATSFTGNKKTNDPRVATNSHTMPSGDLEMMTKATARPRRTAGWLANHHHAYCDTTTDIVGPRHPMLRHGHKTMMITMPRRALHQVKMVFLASQVN
jgi:hypothetical protein